MHTFLIIFYVLSIFYILDSIPCEIDEDDKATTLLRRFVMRLLGVKKEHL